eukprot:TRINITY_DN20729_c2_g1_i1.p1 TRINITY_DN20729_c2_g1~~TRINITY_DN20729_c2_g1_i1.p1  ORF type:complete len:225 (-),score=36.47 TRINITY_DN20729_c2_g1_i1:184-858(-)
MSGNASVPETIECQIVATSGSKFVVQAQRSWKVWELKDGIRQAMKIPSYEQHLLLGNVKVRGKDALSKLSCSTHDVPLTFTMVRSSVPDGISHHLASLLWRGFIMLGEDCGDTMDGERTASLLRFAGLPDCADLVPGRPDIPASWTFPACLAFVAELHHELAASSDALVESDDGSDEESDTDDDDVAAVLNHYLRFDASALDHDLRCDARLMLRRRQNVTEDAF